MNKRLRSSITYSDRPVVSNSEEQEYGYGPPRIRAPKVRQSLNSSQNSEAEAEDPRYGYSLNDQNQMLDSAYSKVNFFGRPISSQDTADVIQKTRVRSGTIRIKSRSIAASAVCTETPFGSSRRDDNANLFSDELNIENYFFNVGINAENSLASKRAVKQTPAWSIPLA